MCFSASASFTASAVLIPTGIYCLRETMKSDRLYLPIATLPLIFGIQQGIEGFVWWGIIKENITLINIASLGFLFFSHFVWLFWIPFSAFYLENNQLVKKVLRFLASAGFLFGVLLYFPLLVNPNWLHIEVVKGSIYYLTNFFFDNITPHYFSLYVYSLIILLPLLISSARSLNLLGVLITLAAAITNFFFNYAFISVWCFMASAVSIYLVYVVNNLTEFDSLQT
jgi:hypothetical protein